MNSQTYPPQSPTPSPLDLISLSTPTPKANDLRYKKFSTQKDNNNDNLNTSIDIDQLNNANTLTPNPSIHIISTQYTPPLSPSKTRRKLFSDDNDHKRWLSKIAISRKGILMLLGGIFLISLICLGVYLAKESRLVSLLSWVQTIGIWGNVIICFIFVLLGLPFLFGYFPLVVACGVIFGLLEGSLTVILGCMGGSSIGFMLTRFCAKDMIESLIVKEKPSLRAILEVVNQNAFKTVFLTRLVPIPFGFANSLFGISSVPYHKYIVASTLGLIPFQVSFVYIGTTVRSLAEVFSGEIPLGRLQIGILSGQIILIVSFVMFMGVTVKRVIAKASKQDEELLGGNSNQSSNEYDPKSKASPYKLMLNEV
eukprot:TRINITY_DN6118_c0_g2_i5.p1 TRINITY_DN6118_c0_g2~~TRINITY_DN6118_c0_g2_i5.p1  ORF type:complete len:367 (-),score=45.96 TRINITY_DN6118_c0_g2_i5:1269-2369(-)